MLPTHFVDGAKFSCAGGTVEEINKDWLPFEIRQSQGQSGFVGVAGFAKAIKFCGHVLPFTIGFCGTTGGQPPDPRGIFAKMKNEVLTFLVQDQTAVQAEEPMTARGETLSPKAG